MSTRSALSFVDGVSPEPRRSAPRAPARSPAVDGAAAEEALVVDPRASLTPSQAVERKLASLLKGQPVPVSHLLNSTRVRKLG